MTPKAIEQKMARRWHDWTREIATPCMDQVLALGPRAVPDKSAWKRLLRVAALTDTHLQREGARNDLPHTHVAFMDAFESLRREYSGN